VSNTTPPARRPADPPGPFSAADRPRLRSAAEKGTQAWPASFPQAAAVPAKLPVERLIEELHARFRDLGEGALADYIPELATVDPDLFAISVVTCDGFCY
jgi:hypothetical protein